MRPDARTRRGRAMATDAARRTLSKARHVWPAIAKEAARATLGRPLHVALSALGVTWGIVAVVTLLAYGRGFGTALDEALRGAFSIGTVLIWPGQTSLQAGGERAGRRIRPTVDDAVALAALPLVRRVSPELIRSLTIASPSRVVTQPVRGVHPSYARMRSLRTARADGRFVNEEDVERRRAVACLGRQVARDLFGGRPAIGETVRIGGLPFEVVGVLEEKVQMTSYYGPDEYAVFVPYPTMARFADIRHPDLIVAQSVDPARQPEALAQIRGALARAHGYRADDPRGVEIKDSVEVTSTVTSIVIGLRVVLGGIAFATLAIGGVGTLNVMIVSVIERTREIGLRKAVGARPGQILAQFFLEALMVTVSGGVLGLLISWLLVRAVTPRPFLAALLHDARGVTDIHLVLTFGLLATSAGVLMFVGLVSGVWPALRAARVEPIAALRCE